MAQWLLSIYNYRRLDGDDDNVLEWLGYSKFKNGRGLIIKRQDDFKLSNYLNHWPMLGFFEFSQLALVLAAHKKCTGDTRSAKRV